MNRVVLEHHGSILQLYGDGILAVFGAPTSTLENEANSVRAALGMLEALDDFNRDVAEQRLGWPLAIGIGLHRGDVVVGSVGSPEKLEYKAVGDTVVTACRIEDQTKKLDHPILMSDAVCEMLGDEFSHEPAGETRLLGTSSSTTFRGSLRTYPVQRVRWRPQK